MSEGDNSVVLKERIESWGESYFAPPATTEELLTTEQRLGHKLPDELRQLLLESNGIQGDAYGLGLLWTAERIAEDNLLFRQNPDFAELYMPFEGLLFFADSGGGDQFGIKLSGINEVYLWDHESDNRTWVAPNIMRLLEDWMTGVVEF